MSPARILIVDNDVRVLQVLSQTVSREMSNVVVDSAVLAKNALHSLKTHGYDAVLIDRMIPEMGGVALARQMRTIAPFIPIILMSDAVHLSEGVTSSDIFEYLAKPVDHRLLVAALARAISHGPVSRQTIKPANNTELLIYTHCYGD